MEITVENIMDLMIETNYELCFFVHDHTFKFQSNEIPEELLYMRVETIDDPAFQMEGWPLTLNLNEEDFDDIEAFEEEFKDYIEEYCY